MTENSPEEKTQINDSHKHNLIWIYIKILPTSLSEKSFISLFFSIYDCLKFQSYFLENSSLSFFSRKGDIYFWKKK